MLVHQRMRWGGGAAPSPQPPSSFFTLLLGWPLLQRKQPQPQRCVFYITVCTTEMCRTTSPNTAGGVKKTRWGVQKTRRGGQKNKVGGQKNRWGVKKNKVGGSEKQVLPTTTPHSSGPTQPEDDGVYNTPQSSQDTIPYQDVETEEPIITEDWIR